MKAVDAVTSVAGVPNGGSGAEPENCSSRTLRGEPGRLCHRRQRISEHLGILDLHAFAILAIQQISIEYYSVPGSISGAREREW